MRITAGRLRGRNISVPSIAGLRPTPAKVRQALFNILGDIEGFMVLDLFAGSGVMALESLSRGAAAAVSIEQHSMAVHAMRHIQRSWPVEEWKILPMAVEKGLAQLSGRHFDLVFADPPYAQGFSEKLPQWLDTCEISCGQLVVEETARYQPVWPRTWQCTQSRRYGDTSLHFLSRSQLSRAGRGEQFRDTL